VIEGVSVAFAVLLALAVDEWREDRSNRQLGARAEASVLAEVRTNMERLDENAAARDSLLTYLAGVRAALERDKELGSISVDFTPAFLATTAWETARVTRAVHFMDYDRVARMGRLYDFQNLYERSEESFVERVSGIGGEDWSDPAETVQSLERDLARVDAFGDELQEVYGRILELGFDASVDEEETRRVELGR
jgi:hypothetical protein